YQVRPERLGQYIERQRLPACTGRRGLHGRCGLGGYTVTSPRGGLLGQRDRRSIGEGRDLAPRVSRKLTAHSTLSTQIPRHSLSTLERQPRRTVGIALLGCMGASVCDLARVATSVRQDSRDGSRRGDRVTPHGYELLHQGEEVLGVKGFGQMRRHARTLPF